MKIEFADSFSKSLKRLMWHESRIYKTYSLFRHDLPRFFSNIWRFRRGLWGYYWWDHHGLLKFMEDGLTHMSDNVEKKGIEVDISRLKKVEKMRRAVQLIQNYNNDSYTEMAEKELGEIVYYPFEFEEIPDKPGYSRLVEKESEEEQEHNRKVFQRSRDIGESEWNELWEIFKGQDHNDYIKKVNGTEENGDDNNNLWDEWFNGSGMRSWWD
jgi:hypothetical protein